MTSLALDNNVVRVVGLDDEPPASAVPTISAAFEALGDLRGRMVLNRLGIIEDVNDAFCNLYGTTRDYFIGTNGADHMDAREHLHEVLPRNMGYDSASSAVFRFGPGATPRLIRADWVLTRTGHCVAEHVAMPELERMQLTLLKEQQAGRTDAMTEIANRAAILDEGRRLIEQLVTPSIVFFGDVDSFKSVNSEHGHSVGDEVIRAVAARLRGSLRQADFVARWGGDEFFGVLDNARGLPFRSLMMRIRSLFVEDITTSAGPLPVTMSFGCVRLSAPAKLEDVQKQAEAALKISKLDGKNRFSFWEGENITTGDLEPLT